jgi:dTDP-glucose pyrophosphorylase
MDSIHQPPTVLFERIHKLLKSPNRTETELVDVLVDIIEQKSKSQEQLYNQAWRSLMPKSKDYTELDRKVDLDARTSAIKTEYTRLEEYYILLSDVLRLMSKS